MMRFDILSVFPEFFEVLRLSLVGKAQERGLIAIDSHDLRAWTHDIHHTVDGSPAGGGAGMVMKPDIWGKALDDILATSSHLSAPPDILVEDDETSEIAQNNPKNMSSEGEEGDENFAPEGENEGAYALLSGAARASDTVLAIPTPSGTPLSQRLCEDLAATSTHIVIACGRYEGIDARVGEYYRSRGVRVVEYSLGDYVLNGGEVAAVALIEAVSRLVPGMVGNPESLHEESHSRAGLLEYPVYTRPTSWRGLEIPAVLSSGDHGAIALWRSEKALEKTSHVRPDMVAALDSANLEPHARRHLAKLGWLTPTWAVHPQRACAYELCEEAYAQELSTFARATFPDAAPSYLPPEAIENFMAEHLSPEAFTAYLTSPEYIVTVVREGEEKRLERPAFSSLEHAEHPIVACSSGRILAYSLVLVPEGEGIAGAEEGAPAHAQLKSGLRRGPLLELSKFYADAHWRSSGVATLLFEATLTAARQRTAGYEAPYIWLGTNIANKRAQKAYKRLGFERVGKRDFLVGDVNNVDVVFARRIDVA